MWMNIMGKKIFLPPAMPGFHITHYDPDVEYAHLKAVIKHGIGVQEFIKIGDHEIPILTSPMVEPGHIYVIENHKVAELIRRAGFTMLEMAAAFNKISQVARGAALSVESLKGVKIPGVDLES